MSLISYHAWGGIKALLGTGSQLSLTSFYVCWNVMWLLSCVVIDTEKIVGACEMYSVEQRALIYYTFVKYVHQEKMLPEVLSQISCINSGM